MRPYFSYTPKDWEFGFAFYLADWFENIHTKVVTRLPSELSLFLGPFTFSIEFGREITVEECKIQVVK
jgi:hypothetical protein